MSKVSIEILRWTFLLQEVLQFQKLSPDSLDCSSVVLSSEEHNCLFLQLTSSPVLANISGDSGHLWAKMLTVIFLKSIWEYLLKFKIYL